MKNLTRTKILRLLSEALVVSTSLNIIIYLFLLDIVPGFFIVSLGVTALIMFLLGVAIKDSKQTKHTLLRNYPLIGRLRWWFEDERPKIQQYFIEDDKNGTPYNREKRSDVYQKAKGDINTTPFGTQMDVYSKGHEFLKHSMYPIDHKEIVEPRVLIGSKHCTQPYNASIYNISAMSFGALSDAAIKSLNGGAKLGNFYHNTGEGGISPYHLENGGDLCFQIGTGYFGAGKTIDGKRIFDSEMFIKNASLPQVKMIEIKLSQGAKPGHGGVLPAKKNTKEIADIRGIKMGEEVLSPPYHSAFNDADTMIDFIQELRVLSNGKPIGIKMCVGEFNEVRNLIHRMFIRDTYPDFITIDGSEGGTGAAPLVFTNNMGTPLMDGLEFISKLLNDYKLKSEIKIIASGKASSSFDLIKLMSYGADIINGARSFMLSMGCIQAKECNKNTCPVGIATQDRSLINGLDPSEKKVRVYNYHKALIKEVTEVMGAMGIRKTSDLKPYHINIRE